MGDFAAQTALEEIGERRYRAVLHRDWIAWGPAGGYVAATALRAAGAATSFERPVSFVCQYLNVARFDAVELRVESLRSGRRAEALHVTMTQEGKPILDANVWTAAANEGLQHDYTEPPGAPGFGELPDLGEVEPDLARLGFFQNLECRPIGWVPRSERGGHPPRLRAWYRFRPNPRDPDRFVDAGRALILIDSFSWPATWPAHPWDGPSPWIAPNLDLYVRFHRDARDCEWLYNVGRADLAEGGLIAAQGEVWSPDGKILASGSTQLFCSPRPERFR